VMIPSAPALTLVKSAGQTTADRAGDVVAYSFLVTNTGNVTLTNVSVTDTLTAPAAPPLTVTCPVTTLASGASVTCTASYTVSQADVDRGRIDNSAVAEGTPPSGPAVTSPPDTWVVTVAPGSALTLDKTGDRTTASRVGDVVNYSFLVTNTGNVTLSSMSVTDTLTAPAGPELTVDCPATTLASGASVTCTATYVVTQADVDRGRVDESAVAEGTPPTGPAVVTPPDTWAVTIPSAPALTLVKTGDRTTADRVGDVVNYTFLVTNTGNVTLSDVRVADQLVAPAGPELTVVCPATTLAPGASMPCTAPYTVTQADVDNARVDNAATASGQPPTPAGGPQPPRTQSPPDGQRVPIPAVPALTLVKSSTTTTLPAVGLSVPYSFLVTNTGNVTMTGISMFDPKVPNVRCPVTVLAPTASTTCTGSHPVTQADVDAGAVTNTATVTGIPPGGTRSGPVPSNQLTIPAGQAPALLLVKSSTPARVDAAAGDVVVFSYVVTNTGNVAQSDVRVADQFVAPAGPAVTVTCPPTTLAPGESLTCTSGPYSLSQADVDHGRVDDTATASGQPPTPAGGTRPPRTVSPPDDLSVPIPSRPALDLVKDSTPAQAHRVGDTVTYTYVVTNTGNVAQSDIRVADVFVAPAGPAVTVTCPPDTLAAGASLTCTSSAYTLTQADVDHGRVDNTATASGQPPTPAGDPRPARTASPPDDRDVPVPAGHGISVVKSLTEGSFSRVGEVLHYEFLVTNTGNTTLTDVVVTDDRPGMSPILCPATTLAAGASMTCTATYVTTQADVDAGRVDNTATASGQPPTPLGGTPPARAQTPPSQASVPGPPLPVLPIVEPGQPILPMTGTPYGIWHILLLATGLLLLGTAIHLIGRRKKEEQ
jgi:large repetitive protein